MSESRRVAFVTGGTRGIGLGVARVSRQHFNMAVNGLRDSVDVQDVLADLRSAGSEVIYVRGDVADLSQHARMFEEIEQRFGRLDVLVNNAGVAPSQRADLLDASREFRSTAGHQSSRPLFPDAGGRTLDGSPEKN